MQNKIMQSQDIRQLVQKEGKSARNLVTWSVPVTDVSPDNDHQNINEGFTPVTKKTRRNRQHGRPRGDGYLGQSRWQMPTSSPNLRGTPPPSGPRVSEEVCVVVAEHYSDMHIKQRQTRASKSPSTRVDLQARYWSYLFDNLHRAVDEIYATCEADESIIECQEVIMTLELCQKDFEALIKRFQLFERQQLQPKKSNLAWEVRKTVSPVKQRSQGLRKSLSPSSSPSHHHLNSPSQTHKNHTNHHPSQPHDPSNSLHSLSDTSQPHHPPTDTPSQPHDPPTDTLAQPHDPPTDTPSQSHDPPTDTPSQPHHSHTHTAVPSNNTHNKDTLTASSSTSIKALKHPSSDTTAEISTAVRGKQKSNSTAKAVTSNKRTEESLTSTSAQHKPSKATSHHKTHGTSARADSYTASSQPKLLSRPSSARSLDFSTCSNERRVNSPLLKRSKSHGKAESEARARRQEERKRSKVVPNGLTWADKVRGFAKPIATTASAPNKKKKNSVPDRTSVASSGKEPDHSSDEGSELEDGWERVTRFRSRSASSGRSGNGSHKHSAQAKEARLRKKTKLSSSNSNSRSCSSASTEPTTPPVFDEAPSLNVTEPKPLQEESVLVEEDKMVESSVASQSEERDKIPSQVLATESTPQVPVEVGEESTSQELEEATQVVVEEVKKKPEEPTSEADQPWTWNDVMADYEAGESYRQEVGWADRCDSPPEVLPEIPRSPGRAIHLHQRLSSPSRRRLAMEDVEETRRIHREKQVKAELHRSRLQEEKTQKYKMVSDKVREARESRDARIRQQREALEGKLHRAEMLRESHLQEIVRKAQEEEAKVSEISFINTLEAQNKKMEVLERHEVHKARLQELQDERQRKREEQLAKEEAAMERRKILESERMAKLMEQEVKRKEQEAKIEQMRQEREKAREDSAREKARERERKLEARNAAIQTSVEELERKIQQKHDESLRRYGQQLEQKKMVAVSISRHASSDDAPNVEVYKKKKWCTLCDVGIISEVYLLSHLRGRNHQEALALLSSEVEEVNPEAPVIIEADEEQQRLPVEKPEVLERLKAGKKRAKKLRHKMASRLKEEALPAPSVPAVQSKNRAKLQRSIKELNRQLDAVHSATNPTPHTLAREPSQLSAIERCLGDLSRCLSGGEVEDRLCFCQLGGLSAVTRLFVPSMLDSHKKKRPPDKALQYAITVLQATCSGRPDSCAYLVLSNKMAPLVDLSLQLLSEVHSGVEVGGGGASQGSKVILLCGGLIGLVAGIVSTLASGPLERQEDVCQPVFDLVSYLVSVGVVDKVSEYFGTINGPIADLPVTQLVLSAINLIVSITACLHIRVVDVFSDKPCSHPPSFLTLVLHQTELVYLMQLLYAILLHDGPPRHSSAPPLLTQHTLAIATAAIKAVNNSAILDLRMVQSCLGAEGISLEFRHVVSYLLWYCSHNHSAGLLHELILAVGYFCVLNRDNQVFLQSGRSPTLLQLLCDLPFQYFSNPELTNLLFPTLISACYHMEENVGILEQEISCKLLVAFLQEVLAREKSSRVAASDKQDRSVDFGQFEYRFPQSEWEKAIKFFNR